MPLLLSRLFCLINTNGCLRTKTLGPWVLCALVSLVIAAPALAAEPETKQTSTQKQTEQSDGLAADTSTDTSTAKQTAKQNTTDDSKSDDATTDGGSVAAYLTIEQVQSHLDVLVADKSLDPVMRDQATQMYRTAISRLQAAKISQQAANNYRSVIDTSRATLDETQQKIDQIKNSLAGVPTSQPTTQPTTKPTTKPTSQPSRPLTTKPGSSPDGASAVASDDAHVTADANNLAQQSLESLEQLLASKHFEETSLRGDLVELQSKLSQMSQRPTEARQELVEARQKLVTLDRQQPEEAGEQTIATQASRTLLVASRIYWPQRINELEQELVSLPKRRDLLTLKRKLIEEQFELIQHDAQLISNAMDHKRQALATYHARQAKDQADVLAQSRPLLLNYAQQNTKLSEQILKLSRDLAHSHQERQSTQDNLINVQSFQRSADQILQIGASGEAFGQLLLTLRAKLPDADKVKQKSELKQQAIVKAKLADIHFRTEQESLQNPRQVLEALNEEQSNLFQTPTPLNDADYATFEELAAARLNIIAILLEMQSDQIDTLQEVYSLQTQLLQLTQTLARTLDERLIWLPSMPRIGTNWFKQIGQGIWWMIDPQSWLIAGKAIIQRVAAYPALTAFIVLLVVLILYLTPRIKRRIAWIAEQIGRLSTDSFIFTPQVFLLALVLAMPWALLIGYIGWLLQSDPSHLSFTKATGHGLMAVAILLGLLGSFSVMCRKNNLFGTHFRWHESARKVLGHNLKWLIVVECIAGFFVAASQNSGNEVFRSGLGRLSFLFGSIGLCYFVYRIFHPTRGAISSVVKRGSWVWRSRGIWFTMLVAPPFILGVLAIMGYYQTASQIQSRIFTTAWVVLLGLIFNSMGMRMVVVAHRRLAVKRARAAREKAQAAKETNQEVQESGEAVPHMLDLPDVDLSSVSDQTRTLLRWVTTVVVGVLLWMLWSELVPALNILQDITLWRGSIATAEGQQEMPITLLAVLTGMLTVAMTIVAAKNLPGLLEITALSRLTLDSGTRYAFAAISRYVIIMVGLLIAFDQIGIQWSKMQWIVAALGVGLGFGLQEIVANFVSGMIILFERPVRVGDTVTVNTLSGTISRIQIRATTIVDWDNREILVPNKSFITEQVVNWTLSDPVTRLVMKVGIAYGSDTALAHKLMMEVVKAHPMVLDTPAPTAFFLGFGDSSLDFEVRIFVSELSKRMLVLHDVHMAINKSFAEHDIEIPFPQRDLHIRSSDIKWPVLEAGQPASPALRPDQQPDGRLDGKPDSKPTNSDESPKKTTDESEA